MSATLENAAGTTAETRKKPFHRQVADLLIQRLREGTAPWQRPWIPGRPLIPENPATGRAYRGVNVVSLLLQGRDDHRWLTYRQAERLGYRVRRGERGTPTQYWAFSERVNRLDPASGQPELDAEGRPVKVEVELEKPRLILSYVFNASQMEGIPPPERRAPAWHSRQRAEAMLSRSGVVIRHDQRDAAFYVPSRDEIHLPPRENFPSEERYYDAALHELVHATAHPSRLDRPLSPNRDSPAQAREELVAQLASLMLGGEIGIAVDPYRNAGYLESWVRELANHPLEICRAAQQADRILNHILEREREQTLGHVQAEARPEPAQIGFSPRHSVHFLREAREALRLAEAGSELAHVFAFEGKRLAALKESESRLPGVPTGPDGEALSLVAAYDAEGGIYEARLRETFRSRGEEASAAEKEAVAIVPTGKGLDLPLDWTGELAVRACREDEAGEARAVDGLSDSEADFFAVFALRRDGGELRLRDFDRRDNAREFASLLEGEWRRQTEPAPPEIDRENRVYLNVPYAEREEAKALGARWNREAGAWHLPPGPAADAARKKWQSLDPEAVRAAREARQNQSAARPGRRFYLEVPREEKDAAKELGARWDRAAVAWYVPEGVNPDPLLSRWPRQNQTRGPEPTAAGQSERIRLAVPYREKEEAKAAGAAYDPGDKTWYAAPGADREKLARWLPENRPELDGPELSPREEFAAVLLRLGASPGEEHPILDKQTHRLAVEGDRNGEKSGFYICHPDGHPAGYAKNNRTQEEVHWAAKGYVLSPGDREKLREKAGETLARREAIREEQGRKAVERLKRQLAQLKPAESPTPYLEAKGLPLLPGVHVAGNSLCVPAYDIRGELQSLQYIQKDGGKRFAKNSRREGAFHPVGGMEELRKAPALIVAEGYATAASLSLALGRPVAAAFDAGNLLPVCQALRQAFPDRPLIVAGDDDRHLESRGKPNVGREKALQAAQAVGGATVFPVFAPEELAGKARDFTDFNDLAERGRFGKEGVKSQVGAVIAGELEKQARAREPERELVREEREMGRV
ncbi:MAG: DUF5710 domain-containing protein [Planctomycetota bacterium]|jgi:antirestriction protein ArdC/phage/plasmid primase-like uncharacterized protein|nr:DUF5710 domain-containing protein [Planctomycetota bacterium]